MSFRRQSLRSYKQILIKAVEDEYINLSWAQQVLLGIGNAGIARAKKYVSMLKALPDDNQWVFWKVLADIRQKMGEGELETSANLRLTLAVNLCRLLGYTEKEIYACTQNVIITPGPHHGGFGSIAYSAQTRAALRLIDNRIKTNNSASVDQNLSSVRAMR